jgi:hypothetical protein
MITLTITCNRCGKEIPSGAQHLEASYKVVNPIAMRGPMETTLLRDAHTPLHVCQSCMNQYLRDWAHSDPLSEALGPTRTN